MALLNIPSNNCEINLILTWSGKCLLSNDRKATTFAITDIKLYVPAVTLSTQDNTKMLEKLKSSFKRTINWNKYDQIVSVKPPNPYLDFLINPIFQGVNIPFVLSFESKDDRTVYKKYYVPTIEMKDYSVMINGSNFFMNQLKNNLLTCDNIRKIVIGRGNDYTTDCLLDYNILIITTKL